MKEEVCKNIILSKLKSRMKKPARVLASGMKSARQV